MAHGTSGSLPEAWDLGYYAGGKNGEVTTQSTSSGYKYQQQILWTSDYIITTKVFSEPD